MHKLDKKHNINCKCDISSYTFYGSIQNSVNSLVLNLWSDELNTLEAYNFIGNKEKIPNIIHGITEEGRSFSAIIDRINPPNTSTSDIKNPITRILIQLKLLLFCDIRKTNKIFGCEFYFQDSKDSKIKLLFRDDTDEKSSLAEIGQGFAISHQTLFYSKLNSKQPNLSEEHKENQIVLVGKKEKYYSYTEIIDIVLNLLPFYTLILNKELKLKYLKIRYYDKSMQYEEMSALFPVKQYNEFILPKYYLPTESLVYEPQLLAYYNVEVFNSIAVSYFEKLNKSKNFKNCVHTLYEVISDFTLFKKEELSDLLFCKLEKALSDFCLYKEYKNGEHIDILFQLIDNLKVASYPNQFRINYAKNIIDIKNKYKPEDKIGKFIKNVRANFLHTEYKNDYNIDKKDLEGLLYNLINLLILEINQEIGLHDNLSNQPLMAPVKISIDLDTE